MKNRLTNRLMKKTMNLMMLFTAIVVAIMAPSGAWAQSPLEGEWTNVDGSKTVRFNEFNGKLTLAVRAYYSDGSPSDYFFEFKLPKAGVKADEIIHGRMRSVDGYYGCLFDEPAEIMLTASGQLKVHHTLLTFHTRTTSVRDRDREGWGYQRRVDWTDWGWVETVHSFPIERWRVTNVECVIDQRNWVTHVMQR